MYIIQVHWLWWPLVMLSVVVYPQLRFPFVLGTVMKNICQSPESPCGFKPSKKYWVPMPECLWIACVKLVVTCSCMALMQPGMNRLKLELPSEHKCRQILLAVWGCIGWLKFFLWGEWLHLWLDVWLHWTSCGTRVFLGLLPTFGLMNENMRGNVYPFYDPSVVIRLPS